MSPGGCSVKMLVTLITILLPALLAAGHIPTVCHNELSSWIKADRKLTIVDIQSAEGFRAHNYTNSLATENSPAQLSKIAARLRSSQEKVIVVSATGGPDAVHAMDKLVRGGVKRSRILLLEGGMQAAAAKTSCDCCKPAATASVAP